MLFISQGGCQKICFSLGISFFCHRICRPHPRCWRPSKPCGLKTSPGTQQVSRWLTAAHWLCKGLTAYNPSDGHPVCRAGPQEYHYSPRSDHGGKPAAGGPAPFGRQECPAPFPAKGGRSARRLSPPARHGALAGFAPGHGNVPAVLVIQFSSCLPAGRRGLLSFAFANLLILL